MKKQESKGIRTKKLNKFKIQRFVILLAVFCLFSMLAVSTVFSRYVSKAEQGDIAYVGSFAPEVTYEEPWSSTESFTASGQTFTANLPFRVNNVESETYIKAVVTVTYQGILPLEYTLYPCAEADVATATPLTPVSAEGNTLIYEIEMGIEEKPFTLSVNWKEGFYHEYLNGLTDTMHISVVCEQV